MSVSNYQNLIIWQKAMDLTVEIYKVVKLLPKEELFALSSQMRRSAVSVTSNIAEGAGRQSAKEFHYFLRISKGSAAELETQLLICQKIGYLTYEHINRSISLLTEISKMITIMLNPPHFKE